MGEFILLTAQARAEEAGVQAGGTVRQGNVVEEITVLAKEIEASHVILGQPRNEELENVFTSDRLQAFVQQLEEETGAKVMLTEPGGEE
jgi:RNase H-fold protein (predicted Holliday junction resolvase)